MATIYGTSRADELYDSAGNDKIYGYAGNDVINGWNGGTDVVAAGAGDDHVDLANSDSRSKIYGDDGNDGLSNFTDADENGGGGWIYGGNGNDSINGNGYLSGDAGNDTVHGGWWQINTILGGSGDDRLDGIGTLNGGSGRDTLANNVYSGNWAKMTGGTQADRFNVSFDDGTNPGGTTAKVRITDFHHSEGDKLDLSSNHLTGEGPYWGYYSRNAGDLFATFDADKNGKHDNVIRIGDFGTSKSAEGDLQLHIAGSMLELDGVHSIAASDWIHGT